jgi:CBS domain-containing protein
VLQAYRESGDTRAVLPLQAWDGGPAGLVSLDQLVGVPADQRDDVRVATVAAPLDQVVVTEPGEPLTQLVTRLRPTGRSMAALRLVGHALIVSDGRPVGVVTPADFARAAHLSKLGGPPRPPVPPTPSTPPPSGSDTAGAPSEAPRRSAAA